MIFISQKLPNALPSLITFIGSLIMLFILDWQMTLLLFIVIPIFALIKNPYTSIDVRGFYILAYASSLTNGNNAI